MSVNPDRLCSWRPPHESVGDCAEGPGRGLHCAKRIARRSFLAPSRLFSCSTTAPFRLRNSPPAVSAANHIWKHYRLWQFTSTAQNCTRQFLGQSVRSSLSTLSFVNVISAAGRRLAQGAQSFVQLPQVYAYASADGYAERGYWSGSDFQFAASTHRQPSTNQLPNATQTQPANLTSPQLIPCARGCPQVVCVCVVFGVYRPTTNCVLAYEMALPKSRAGRLRLDRYVLAQALLAQGCSARYALG